MAMIDLDTRQIVAKIVIYGPGRSGKTTYLRAVDELMPAGSRPALTSIEDDAGRTVLYDSLPIDVGPVGGFDVRFDLYTVAGNDGSQDARRAVLAGADGVVFMADAQPNRLDENNQRLQELLDMLRSMQKDPAEFPVVLQYNKVDLVDDTALHQVRASLNPGGLPETFSSALYKRGIVDALQTIARRVLQSL